MHDRFVSRLLGHLRHENYSPANLDRLMEDLGVEASHRDQLEAAVRTLVERGSAEVDDRGTVRLPRAGRELVGLFRKNARGFGFVQPSTSTREGSVFIPPDAVGEALTGDTVRIEVRRGKRDGKDDLTGRVVEVLERKRKVFTGELVQRGSQWLVFPDGRELTDPIVIRDPHARNARAGDKCVVELTAYPVGTMLPEGVIVDVLGEAGLPSVETQATIAAYNLPGEFPEAVVAQARRAADQFQREVEVFEYDPELAGKTREDMRSTFILTIDPPDAKDYDDALHLTRLPARGGGDGEAAWELGVHIADVAHFIPVGTPLDDEARARGNSVYLPRLVIPMLPEVLSNGICSLQEGVPRFCKTAIVHYDRGGRVVRSGVASTLIHSAKRLTYLEAQALIDGDETEARKHARTEPNYTPQLLATLRDMDTLARAIRQRRRAAGMIHLDLPEVDLVFDEHGRVVDAQREDDAFTHTLIEMFMVEANEVLARLFEKLAVPLLRRVHPEPAPGSVDDLRDVVKVAGFSIPKRPTRQELQALLDATRGTPAAPAVHFAVLRSLTRAEYSPDLIGHFALASEAYAHFTSPIRRYPDLTVHRALAEYLRHTANGKTPPRTEGDARALGRKMLESKNCPDAGALSQIGRHCTRTEANASDAEESLKSFLVLQLLTNHVGETFAGMVTGVRPVGVFVQLEKFLAEGMIKKEDLPGAAEGRGGGNWRMDERSGALVNQSTGASFKVGDQVTVQIAAIDLALRRMDLVMADPSAKTKAPTKKYPKRGSAMLSSPTGPVGAAGAGAAGGLGGLGPRSQKDWDRVKFGQDGGARRSAKSKSRDKGKKQHRRDK